VSLEKARRLDTPPDRSIVPSEGLPPPQATLVESKMGKKHKRAARRIQSVFRGHVGRAIARQVLMEMYAAVEPEDARSDGYDGVAESIGLEEAQPSVVEEVLQRGRLERDVSGSLSSCAELCLHARHELERGDLLAAFELYSQAAQVASAGSDLEAEITESVDALEAALTCDAPSASERCEALCAQAKQQLASARVEDARRCFTAALLYDPEHFESLCGRAAVWVRMREYERAVADTGVASALNRSDARVHSLEGAARLGLGDMAGARTCFQRGLRIDAGNKFMRAGLEAAERFLEQQAPRDRDPRRKRRRQKRPGKACSNLRRRPRCMGHVPPPRSRCRKTASPASGSHRSSRRARPSCQVRSSPPLQGIEARRTRLRGCRRRLAVGRRGGPATV